MGSRPLTAVLVGVRHCEYESTLALGMLKAAADARPSLRGRVEVSLRTFTTADDAAAAGAALGDAGADLVGVSCYLWNVAFAGRLAGAYKRRRPVGKVVLGGGEPTSRPAETLAGAPAADWVAVGEAEETFADLLERLVEGRDPAGVAGLVWREGGSARSGPPRAPRAQLDALPSPYESGILPHGGHPHVCFEASRGCPFDCKYCDWQNKQRVRRYSEARAVGDMRLLLKRQPGARVFVCDSDLFLEPRRGTRLARAWRAAARGAPCVWEVHTYLPRLDDDALRAIDSPQFTVCVGLQSANPRALAAVSRFFDADRIRERAAAFRRLAPRARLNLQLIYGLPGDDPGGFALSLDYALSLEPDSLMLFPALALPGSELGREPAAFGLRVQREPPYRVLETPGFTPAALAEADFLSFQLFTLQRHRAAARVLRHIGRALVGRVPRARLAAFAGFARALAGTALDLAPAYARARRDLLGFVTFAEEPWAGLPPSAREAEVLRSLDAYARRTLAQAGASDAWPSLERYLAAERRAALWRELVAGPRFHRLFDTLLGGAEGGTLWVGTETAAEAEARFWPRAARWHWLSPGPGAGEPCRGARHFGPADLAEGAPAGRGGAVSAAAVSQVCRWLPSAARRELFRGLRRRARAAARLAVFDSLLVPGAVEADGSAGGAPLDAGSLAGELRDAGWRLVREPLRLGDAGGGWTALVAEAA